MLDFEEVASIDVVAAKDGKGHRHITVSAGDDEARAKKRLAELKEALRGKVPDKEIEEIAVIARPFDKGMKTDYRIDFPNKGYDQSKAVLRLLGITDEEKFKNGEQKYKELFDEIRRSAPKAGPLGAAVGERATLAAANVTISETGAQQLPTAPASSRRR